MAEATEQDWENFRTSQWHAIILMRRRSQNTADRRSGFPQFELISVISMTIGAW